MRLFFGSVLATLALGGATPARAQVYFVPVYVDAYVVPAPAREVYTYRTAPAPVTREVVIERTVPVERVREVVVERAAPDVVYVPFSTGVVGAAPAGRGVVTQRSFSRYRWSSW